jgi:hypothetical protein
MYGTNRTNESKEENNDEDDQDDGMKVRLRHTGCATLSVPPRLRQFFCY